LRELADSRDFYTPVVRSWASNSSIAFSIHRVPGSRHGFVSPKRRRNTGSVSDGIEAAAAAAAGGGGRGGRRRRELPAGPRGPGRDERAAGPPRRRPRGGVLQRVVPAGRGPGARRDAEPRRQGQDHRAGAAAVHVPRLPRPGAFCYL